jgi:hypothetical protein
MNYGGHADWGDYAPPQNVHCWDVEQQSEELTEALERISFLEEYHREGTP